MTGTDVNCIQWVPETVVRGSLNAGTSHCLAMWQASIGSSTGSRTVYNLPQPTIAKPCSPQSVFSMCSHFHMLDRVALLNHEIRHRAITSHFSSFCYTKAKSGQGKFNILPQHTNNVVLGGHVLIQSGFHQVITAVRQLEATHHHRYPTYLSYSPHTFLQFLSYSANYSSSHLISVPILFHSSNRISQSYYSIKWHNTSWIFQGS